MPKAHVASKRLPESWCHFLQLFSYTKKDKIQTSQLKIICNTRDPYSFKGGVPNTDSPNFHTFFLHERYRNCFKLLQPTSMLRRFPFVLTRMITEHRAMLPANVVWLMTIKLLHSDGVRWRPPLKLHPIIFRRPEGRRADQCLRRLADQDPVTTGLWHCYPADSSLTSPQRPPLRRS